jgi:uncharacterized protein DUF1236
LPQHHVKCGNPDKVKTGNSIVTLTVTSAGRIGAAVASQIAIENLILRGWRLVMASHFRRFAIALTCLAWASVAGAQDNVPGKTDGSRPPGESQPQTGKQMPQLSPAQKQTIFALIRKSSMAVKPPRDILIAVGAQVPAPTELYSLPHAAADKVPDARPYAYTIVNDALVLVDPASRKIVAIERQ